MIYLQLTVHHNLRCHNSSRRLQKISLPPSVHKSTLDRPRPLSLVREINQESREKVTAPLISYTRPLTPQGLRCGGSGLVMRLRLPLPNESSYRSCSLRNVTGI